MTKDDKEPSPEYPPAHCRALRFQEGQGLGLKGQNEPCGPLPRPGLTPADIPAEGGGLHTRCTVLGRPLQGLVGASSHGAPCSPVPHATPQGRLRPPGHLESAVAGAPVSRGPGREPDGPRCKLGAGESPQRHCAGSTVGSCPGTGGRGVRGPGRPGNHRRAMRCPAPSSPCSPSAGPGSPAAPHPPLAAGTSRQHRPLEQSGAHRVSQAPLLPRPQGALPTRPRASTIHCQPCRRLPPSRSLCPQGMTHPICPPVASPRARTPPKTRVPLLKAPVSLGPAPGDSSSQAQGPSPAHAGPPVGVCLWLAGCPTPHLPSAPPFHSLCFWPPLEPSLSRAPSAASTH